MARDDGKPVGGRRTSAITNRLLQNELSNITVTRGEMLGSAAASNNGYQRKDKSVKSHGAHAA